MNPNAPSFGFNPNAAGFVPRQQAQQQEQQAYDASYYNQGFAQGFNGAGAYGFNGAGYPAAGDMNMQGGYAAQGFAQPGGFGSPAGGGSPAPAPAPAPARAAQVPAAEKPASPAPTPTTGAGSGKKAVSISLGGAKKPAEPAKPEPKPAEPKKADAAPEAAKPAEPKKPAGTGATPASGGGQAAKQQTKVEKKVAEKSAVNADKVLSDAKKATDEETMRDLFGDKTDELKMHLNVVFVGHVDAGKSTMGGNLLYLTGMVDKRTLEKYERDAKEAGRESWYLSWALDSTQQERDKGKTVEVGRAYFETGKRRYTVLDAPGHKSYVPNMIGGAAQADVAILVISARRGEFETGFERGGQTREHAMLVKTAGVQRLVVVVNKMDDPTVQWDKERYDDIVNKLSPFLRSAGFNPKTDVMFLPAPASSTGNLKDPVKKEECDWYTGPPLLEYLDNLSLGDRKISESLKLPVSEKYSDMGTYVVGKLESGKVKKGESLVLMPNRTPVEVLGLYNETDEEVPAAISGDNVRVKLKGVDVEEVQSGFVLTDPREPVNVVTRFEAQLAILEHRNIICAGYSAVMHVHTLSEEVTLQALLHYYDKKTGKKSRKGPQFAKKGMKVIALIQTTAPICLERFKDYPQLGRFTLRDEGKTIAIGKVTKLIQSDDDMPDVAKLTVS